MFLKIKHFHCKGYIWKDERWKRLALSMPSGHMQLARILSDPRCPPQVGSDSVSARAQSASGRQMGKACAWAVSLYGLALMPTWLCSAYFPAGKKSLTPCSPSLVWQSVHPQKGTGRELLSVTVRTWESAQVLHREHKEARAHSVHICTSASTGQNQVCSLLLEACQSTQSQTFTIFFLMKFIVFCVCVS